MLCRSNRRSLASSSEFDTAMEIRVSSAKHLAIECMMQFSMSLINMRNKIGPNTVPWGTPLRISEMREWQPSTTTDCWRLERKDSIHFTIFG